ncbi:MAG: undecaprenyl-diphosphate phosphatase [Alphaproteobacteria bacterium]|nr:undecaprenyl-diphosphate phosphatase [Alphaproteobacteria bacterium]
MPIEQVVVMAVIQGLAGFLPLSASGHLGLAPLFLGWQAAGLSLGAALHGGALVALLLYFWRDVWDIAKDLPSLFKGRTRPGAKLALLLLAATIPTLALAFALRYLGIEPPSAPLTIAWAMAGFAPLLFLFDKFGVTIWRMQHMSISQSLFIGCALCLAFIPGIGGVAASLTAARFLGYERTEAARFALLLFIPLLLGRLALDVYGLVGGGANASLVGAQDLLIAFGATALAGLLAISFLMSWLRQSSLLPFVLYRLAVGLALLLFLYGLTPWS